MRALFSVLLALWLLSCGDASVKSPFGGGGEPGDAGVDGAGSDAGADVTPSLGGPCLDDAQCNDQIECTFEVCDPELKRCRYTPDDSKCADDVYCDGAEVCDVLLGCREGEPVTCSDGTTCTIDTCVEVTQSCDHIPRDADSDGDPDWGCGGGDCDETDPLVSSLNPETCANQKDDDCDKQIDESDCVTPKHDQCVDALDISASGTYLMSLAAAKSDYAASCVNAGSAWRDVVAAIVVPNGGPRNVDIVATSEADKIALAAVGKCDDPSSELACHASLPKPGGGQVARLRLRELAPGAYPLYIFGTTDTSVTIKVDFLPPAPKPGNETCGTALPISAGANQTTVVIDAADDLKSACSSSTGDLVYAITLSQAQDVRAYAVSKDGYGIPSLGLWRSPCQAAADELTCNTAIQASVFARAVPPGTLYLAVSASAPSELDVVVNLSPPSQAPPDETCNGAPALAFNKTLNVPLSNHTDDIKSGCLPGAVDAAYELNFSAATDLLLVGRLSGNDTAAVALSKNQCASSSDVLACSASALSPVRIAAHNLAAGSYRTFVESVNASPLQLTAFTRAAVPPTFVAFADTCAQAIAIPPTGGFFQGNTANVAADYEAGCDFGGLPFGGAPEQMLKLELTKTQRVIFDMKGSSYDTLLNVRKGPGCPGAELPMACAAGYFADRSYLDLILQAGQYFVQVDGYSADAGPWFLDVFVVDP